MRRKLIFLSLTIRNYTGRFGRFILRNRLCFIAALLALPLSYLLLWIFGLSDFFYEIPFRQFYWPPFVDVRKQVVLELLNMPTEVFPENRWEKLFQPVIAPSCKRNRLTRKRSILTIVKTAPERIDQRRAIRSTYGSLRTENFTDGYRFQTIFVMGRPETKSAIFDMQMDRLRQEADVFGDLLIGDFADTYFNNTLKFIYSIGFANNHCGNGPVSYVLLLDDDYLLLPWNLAVEISKHVPNERLYMGWRYDSSPFRLRFQKFHVSVIEYPFDAYPPYITAGAVLLTGQTVREFRAAVQHTALYRFDDIYTGILAYLLAIQPQHNQNFPCHSHHNLNDPNWWRTLIAIHGYKPDELLINYAIAQQKYLKTRMIMR